MSSTVPVGDTSVCELLEAIEVTPLNPEEFRGRTDLATTEKRLFGGLVAAQSLRAAQHTVREDLAVHSIHGYFLRQGTSGAPVVLRVDPVRDGRSFSTRSICAVQDGEVIFTLSASFHRAEPGAEQAVPMPAGVPPAESATHHPTPFDGNQPRAPFEIVEMLPFTGPAPAAGPQRRAWLRTRSPMPEDPALHACVLTYVSDFSAFAALRAINADFDSTMLASLDHAVWFHRPARIDTWTLHETSSVSVSGSRGLVAGTVHACDGTHIASFTQEALLRTATS